jgi:RNA polymerase sigma-70 factor (ECF subfamily)
MTISRWDDPVLMQKTPAGACCASPLPPQPARNCLTTAWSLHASELRGWARHRLGDAAEVDDLLQDLFLKALRQGERFCTVQNARAWLFEVARHTLADRLRVARDTVALPEDLCTPPDEIDTVDALTTCLPRVLAELSPEDREAITLCDLQGLPQAEFAQRTGLGLSAAKSRVQRARQRLRERMTQVCQVQFDDAGHVSDFVPRKAV